MKFFDFPHFDRLWPNRQHKLDCKAKNAKYGALKDMVVKCRFLCILWAVSNEPKWLKNEILKAILALMYAEHVLKKKVNWSTSKTLGSSFGSLGDKLTAKKLEYILYTDVSNLFSSCISLSVVKTTSLRALSAMDTMAMSHVSPFTTRHQETWQSNYR